MGNDKLKKSSDKQPESTMTKAFRSALFSMQSLQGISKSMILSLVDEEEDE